MPFPNGRKTPSFRAGRMSKHAFIILTCLVTIFTYNISGTQVVCEKEDICPSMYLNTEKMER